MIRKRVKFLIDVEMPEETPVEGPGGFIEAVTKFIDTTTAFGLLMKTQVTEVGHAYAAGATRLRHLIEVSTLHLQGEEYRQAVQEAFLKMQQEIDYPEKALKEHKVRDAIIAFFRHNAHVRVDDLVTHVQEISAAPYGLCIEVINNMIKREVLELHSYKEYPVLDWKGRG